MAAETPSKYRIGYVLDPKKVSSFIQPSLVNQSKQRGIDLIQIEPTKPLNEQGQFQCIIHKSYNSQWTNQLSQIRSQYPNLIIIDSPDAIQRLRNRKTMLQVVESLKITGPLFVDTPRQVFVESPERVKLDFLHFPVIAKPLMANGSVGSHQMCLVFGEDGLGELEMDSSFVLQEFVNHGGVLFKVYVAGKHVKCVKRKSLPDVSEELARKVKVLPFSQISNVSVGDQSDESVSKRIEAVELPPLEFVNEVAGELRKGLGLNLFNFDMIRDSRNGERYLVIDINYFPGYAKMPGYETMLTDFFLDIVQGKESEVCEDSESH